MNKYDIANFLVLVVFVGTLIYIVLDRTRLLQKLKKNKK